MLQNSLLFTAMLYRTMIGGYVARAPATTCWLANGRDGIKRIAELESPREPGARRPALSEQWAYQLRINLGDEFAEAARSDPHNPAIKPLTDILARHHATLKCQYDAFAGYISEAETEGVEHFPLYKWTKATIEDPAKKAKYIKSFTLYVDGDEVYSREKADALEAELQPLVGGALITRLSRHDTNPANNPQAPAHLR